MSCEYISTQKHWARTYGFDHGTKISSDLSHFKKKLIYKGANRFYPSPQSLLTVELELVYKIFLPQFAEHVNINNKPT